MEKNPVKTPPVTEKSAELLEAKPPLAGSPSLKGEEAIDRTALPKTERAGEAPGKAGDAFMAAEPAGDVPDGDAPAGEAPAGEAMERAFPGLEAAAAGRGEEAAGERPGKRAAVVDALGSRRNQEAGSPSLTAWQSAGAARPGLVDALRERDESREPGRLAEARSRKHKAPAGGAGAEEAGERLAPAGGPQSGPQGEAASFTSHRGTESEILVDLKLNGGNPQNSAPAEAAGGAPSGAPSFESALAREIEGNLGYNILREAQIIARSGGEGTIKLSLKPETLGNVKIRLEMAENKITGRILVESPEALRAFSRELPVLEQSFRDSGFNGASLELSLAQEGAGGQESGGQNGAGGNGAENRYFPEFAAASYEEAPSGEGTPFMSGGYGFQAGGVNLWI